MVKLKVDNVLCSYSYLFTIEHSNSFEIIQSYACIFPAATWKLNTARLTVIWKWTLLKLIIMESMEFANHSLDLSIKFFYKLRSKMILQCCNCVIKLNWIINWMKFIYMRQCSLVFIYRTSIWNWAQWQHGKISERRVRAYKRPYADIACKVS